MEYRVDPSNQRVWALSIVSDDDPVTIRLLGSTETRTVMRVAWTGWKRWPRKAVTP